MTYLIFGSTGQVAIELKRILPRARFLARSDADLTHPLDYVSLIDHYKPSAVINAAAYTAVDRAEDDIDVARAVNADSPTAMAQACADLDIPFVHISTDYVFDGTGVNAFTPGDPTGPLGVYGKTKLAGEDGIRGVGGVFAILRTSWVFSAHGNNFVKTMLRLSETRDALSVVGDQIGGPTSARAIAEACVEIAKQLQRDPHKSGTFHFSGAPDASWADFSRRIFQLSNRSVDVTDIPSAAYPTPAARPLNSRLDCSLTLETFNISRPVWATDLENVLTDLEIM